MTKKTSLASRIRRRTSTFSFVLGVAGLAMACGSDSNAPASDSAEATVEHDIGESAESLVPPSPKPGAVPRITSATLMPSEPLPGSLLVLSYETTDHTGSELIEGFLWMWNDSKLDFDGADITVPAEARRGDVIKVRMIVRNQRHTSEEVWREVIVENTAEEWLSLSLTPGGEVAPGTRINVTSAVFDHDQDALEYEYVWELNGRRHPNRGMSFPTDGLRGGETISVTVKASDGTSWGSDLESNTVTIANSDPRITSKPPGFSKSGQLRYEITAKDPDGGRRFEYTLDAAPESMQLDPYTGVLTWTPSELDIGTHAIEIRVSDPEGGYALQHFELTIGQSQDTTSPASIE
jgi:hypothetical protein